MTEDPSQSRRRPDDDDEMGEPIGALRELQQNTSASFVSVIRKKIQRRTTASQLLSFSWQLPKIVFFELGNMLAQILNVFSIRKGE
jgi:hypothetical protein